MSCRCGRLWGRALPGCARPALRRSVPRPRHPPPVQGPVRPRRGDARETAHPRRRGSVATPPVGSGTSSTRTARQAVASASGSYRRRSTTSPHRQHRRRRTGLGQGRLPDHLRAGRHHRGRRHRHRLPLDAGVHRISRDHTAQVSTPGACRYAITTGCGHIGRLAAARQAKPVPDPVNGSARSWTGLREVMYSVAEDGQVKRERPL